MASRIITLTTLAALCLAGLACGDQTGKVCEPDSLRVCSCPDGEGFQACRGDGSEWLPCECPDEDGSPDAGMDGADEVREDAGGGDTLDGDDGFDTDDAGALDGGDAIEADGDSGGDAAAGDNGSDAGSADTDPADGGDTDGGDGATVCTGPACLPEGQRFCTEQGYIACEQTSPGCLVWVETTCPPGQTCSTFFSSGAQVECATTCEDECFPASGWGQCERQDVDAVYVHMHCGLFDADACNDYVVEAICQAGQLCYDEEGCVDCLDECPSDGHRYCPSNLESRVCGYFDEDACLDWDFRPCAEDESCDSDTGMCVCKDMCYVQGQTSCRDYYSTRRCEDHDSDGCLEWGQEQDCPADETCEDGVCSTNCSDQCLFEGRYECYQASTHRRICGYWDTDPCLDWSPIEPCPQGTFCYVGAPSGDPCVECGNDCRPELMLCRDHACVPPPGECFPPSGSTRMTIELTATDPVLTFSVFLGMTNTLFTDPVVIRLHAPDGRVASLVECDTLPGDDVFWDIFHSDDTPDLAQFTGESAQGTWTLDMFRCADTQPTFELWALCLEFVD